jgi:hypothetical protein
MKGDRILMSQKQLQRFRVIGLAEIERIPLKEASGKMRLSYRQTKRFWKRVQEQGAEGLRHGNTGRSPQNRIPDKVKKNILELSCQKLAEWGTFVQNMLGSYEETGTPLNYAISRKRSGMMRGVVSAFGMVQVLKIFVSASGLLGSHL